MMDEITGETLDELPYTNIRKVADLTYYEGPLLSLFRNAEGKSYLYHWCDFDDISNRWLVYQITEQQFEHYLTQRITLRSVITNPVDDKMYAVDIDGEGNHLSVLSTRPEQLPEDYFPRENTFYDPGNTIFYEDSVCSECLAILLDEIGRLQPKVDSPKQQPKVSEKRINGLAAQEEMTFDFATEATPLNS